MIWAFATGAWASFAKLPRAFHIAFAVLLLCIAAFTLHRCAVDDAREKGEATGVTAQREANLSETVKNVEKANAAAENVVHNIDAGRDECLRNARNPSDC